MSDTTDDGWTSWNGKPGRFSSLLGGHRFRIENGKVELHADPEEQHLNNNGVLHGGYLMSVADQALFAIARPLMTPGMGGVTLTFNSEFLGAGVAGKPLMARGEVLRETGKMFFVRGLLEQDEQPILAFSGTLRKVTRRT